MIDDYTLPAGNVLALRVNEALGYSTQGFQWPSAGPVEAPSFDGTPFTCGPGLHGLLWGHGDRKHLPHLYAPGVQWQVVEVTGSDIVHVTAGKVRFPRGLVLLTTTSPAEAVRFINKHRPPQVPTLTTPGWFAAIPARRRAALMTQSVGLAATLLVACSLAGVITWLQASLLLCATVCAGLSLGLLRPVGVGTGTQPCTWVPRATEQAVAASVPTDPIARLEAEMGNLFDHLAEQIGEPGK